MCKPCVPGVGACACCCGVKSSLRLKFAMSSCVSLSCQYVFINLVIPSSIVLCGDGTWLGAGGESPHTVNFAYNDTRRASEKCPYSRSVVIPEVSLYVSQLNGTLLWA